MGVGGAKTPKGGQLSRPKIMSKDVERKVDKPQAERQRE